MLLLRQPRLRHNPLVIIVFGIRAMIWRTVLASLLLAFSSAGYAGRFTTAEFGPATAGDVRDLVSEAFTRKYPADRWSIFMYSAVNRTTNGALHCYGISGVTPKGSDKFPIRSFSYSIQQRQSSGSDTAAEKRDLAIACARGAVEAMMAEDVHLIYVPPPK